MNRKAIVDAVIATAKYYQSKGLTTIQASFMPLIVAIVDLYEHQLDLDGK